MPAPAIGTVVDGYRFKGGDPNSQGSWEQVGIVDASAEYGAGARQLPNGVIERVGPRGGVTRIGSANGGRGDASSGLVSAEARSRYQVGLGPVTEAQRNLAAMEAQHGNVFNREWGARMLEAVPFDNGVAARVVGGQDYQNYEQAARSYESAILPILSGAAVTDGEALRTIRADLPQLGDSEETLRRKAENRRMRINAIAEGIGKDQPFPEQAQSEEPVDIGGMSATDLLKLQPGTPIRLPDGTVTRLTGAPSVAREGREVSPGVFVSEESPEGATAQRRELPNWWRRIDGAVRGAADMATFGLADEFAAGADAAIGRGQGQDFGQRYQNNLQVQRGLDRADSQDIPVSRLTGQVAGGMAAPGAMAAGRYATQAPNALGGIGRGMAVGAGYGAAYGGGSAEVDRLRGAAGGAVAGGATGGALTGLGRGVGGLFGGGRPRSPDAATLQANGVFTTPGAQRGGLAKSIEDLAQRAPILGGAIRGARGRSVDSLNRAVANRSLAHINQGLPGDVPVGGEATRHVAQKLGAEFDRAAEMVPQVNLDDVFAQRMGEIARGKVDLSESAAAQFDSILRDRLSRLSGPVSGAQLRRVESELGTVASEVQDQTLRRMLSSVQTELQDLLGRTNPEAGQVLQRARAGWRDYATMRRASQAAGGNPFSPRQLLTAVRGEDSTVGNSATAQASAPLQDLARAAVNVIPDGYGNPGTADALGYGGLAAMTVGNPIAGGATAGGLAAAATPYFMMGRKVVESLPPNPSPQQAQAAIQQLEELAQRDPSVRQLQQMIMQRLPGMIPAASAMAGGQ